MVWNLSKVTYKLQFVQRVGPSSKTTEQERNREEAIERTAGTIVRKESNG